MDELKFKKEYKFAACSAPPWQVFIPAKDRPEILRIIRQECIDAYGFAFDECPKRLTCFSKSCEGRPLPWLSPTAKPYLEQLVKVSNIKSGELFITTDCSTCPVAKTCKSPCNQIIDYIEKEKTKEPTLYFRDTTERLDVIKESLEPANFIVTGKDIPWEVLPKRKQEVIKKYLFEGRDFRYVGESLGLNNQARAKYEFYSAITKLSEYAVVRSFYTKHKEELTARQRQIFDLVYYQNMSFIQVANELTISKQSVQQTVSRVLRKYGVTWKTYVKKQGNKVIYNVPQIFKA